MFGYRAEDLLKKRRRERWEAQKVWPFLTESDLRSIRSSADLSKIVGNRLSISRIAADEMVDNWMVGYWRRLSLGPPLAGEYRAGRTVNSCQSVQTGDRSSAKYEPMNEILKGPPNELPSHRQEQE